jgi:hypothetical protein
MKLLWRMKIKTINLTQGYTAIVDDEDFDRVNQFKWHIVNHTYGRFAASRGPSKLTSNKRKLIVMHKFIWNNGNDKIVHNDGNRLNNQKNNFHICTKKENFRKLYTRRIFTYLKDHPCVDCGILNPLILQFDHVNGVKKDKISNMVAVKKPWNEILDEISKCEVRCANCHIVRHAVKNQWYMVTLMEMETDKNATESD